MRKTIRVAGCLVLCGGLLTCASPKVEVDGTSTAEIELPKGAKLKLPAGTKWTTKEGVVIVIPEPGVEINAGEGGKFTIKDKVESRAQSSSQRSDNYTGNGTLLPGSTYEFTFAAALGANPSTPVPLSGGYSFVARPDVLMPGPNGTQVLNPAGLLQFTYHASGPAPSWPLPLLGTPLGDFEGPGAIEAEPFSVDFNGNLGGLSGTLAGNSFTLTIPLTLTMGTGGGQGSETEVGRITEVPQPVAL